MLSVLMSVYYKENPFYLDECFQSLLEQSKPADEIVCVKDGRLTPELGLVLDKWAKILPLKIVGYENNHGLAYALNFGLRFCSGEFIARMDTDDQCHPDRFREQIDFLSKNPETVLFGTGILERYYSIDMSIYEKERIYADHITKASPLLYKGTPVGHPTIMIRKALLEKYLYNENVGCNEDIELWFRILADGYEIRNIQKCLYFQRFDSSVFQRRNYRKSLNEYKIYSTQLYMINGFSFKLIFPILRFLSRLLPQRINRWLYLSRFRTKLFKDKIDIFMCLFS